MSEQRIPTEIRRDVRERANLICEYCLLSEADSYFAHQIEHIISLKHGGSSNIENLALACVFCNRNKGSDLGSVIPSSNLLIRFFNPRTDIWAKHFRLEGSLIEPLTDIGVVTARIFKFNIDDRVLEREILIRTSRFPDNAASLLLRDH